MCEDIQEEYKSKFLCVVDRKKSILIIPAPSGFLLMNAPVKEDEDKPLEKFAALSGAADVIQYLMDLYGDWLEPPKTDDSYDAVYELLEVGRVDPSPKQDAKELSKEVPVVEIQPPIESETPAKEAIPIKQPLEIAKSYRVKQKKPKKTDTPNVATKIPQIPNKPKEKEVGFMCKGCGETYEKKPDSCSKCSVSAFEEIPKYILKEMSNEH